jgi:hypothetical protein
MLGVYAILLWLDFSIYTVIMLFGLLVSGVMALVRRHHLNNVRSGSLPTIPSDTQHVFIPRQGKEAQEAGGPDPGLRRPSAGSE